MATFYKGIELPPGKEYLYALAKDFGSAISNLAENDANGRRIPFNATPAEMLALVEQVEGLLAAEPHGPPPPPPMASEAEFTAAARAQQQHLADLVVRSSARLSHPEVTTSLRKAALIEIVAKAKGLV